MEHTVKRSKKMKAGVAEIIVYKICVFKCISRLPMASITANMYVHLTGCTVAYKNWMNGNNLWWHVKYVA